MAYILGVKIDELTFKQVIEKINIFLGSNKFHQIATVNPEFIVAAQKDSEFKKILNETDLCVVDGFGLKIGAIISGQKIGDRITGVDLTWEICKIASEKGYTMFLLGGKEGVAKKTGEVMQKKYPNLKIVGTYAGKPNDQQTLDIISKANPNILLVAFGAPKQDKFIYNLKSHFSSHISNLHLAIGVGGTFDYISGKIPRAPKFIRSLGLEWLYRLFRQPSRIGRIYTAVIKFPLLVLWYRLFK